LFLVRMKEQAISALFRAGLDAGASFAVAPC
jgi:hypothetical protein